MLLLISLQSVSCGNHCFFCLIYLVWLHVCKGCFLYRDSTRYHQVILPENFFCTQEGIFHLIEMNQIPTYKSLKQLVVQQGKHLDYQTDTLHAKSQREGTEQHIMWSNVCLNVCRMWQVTNSHTALDLKLLTGRHYFLTTVILLILPLVTVLSITGPGRCVSTLVPKAARMAGLNNKKATNPESKTIKFPLFNNWH